MSVHEEGKRYPSGYEDSDLFKTYPDLYEAVFVNHRNILISGSAGCGKSFGISMIKRECIRLAIQCDLTSTTGVSAHALGYGASTVHRFTAIKLGDKPIEVILKNIRQNPDKLKRWKNSQMLVIDEVSMLGASILELISKIGQEIRLGKKEIRARTAAKQPIPPFGGLQVIFSGDFMQLQPIKDKFSFESSIWPQLNLFNFRVTHPYRYPDPKHFEMLSRVRIGKQTGDDIAALRTRVEAYEEYRGRERAGEIKDDDIKPTRIFPLKKDVETINLAELEKLEGDTIIYDAEDIILIKTTKEGKLVVSPDSVNTADYCEYMDSIVSPEILLKVGAQVMLTKNLSVEEGLVNGARGVVEECHDERIVVRFKCGMIIDIIPHAFEYEDDKVMITRQQFPLILSWAMSCHKSQGSTLDFAIIDLGSSLFAPGMGYVMLSRCKTLQGIFINNIMPQMIRPDETALAFETALAQGSVCAPVIVDIKEKEVETKDDEKDPVDELEARLSDTAIEIEEKVGCLHKSGITMVCKLCRAKKVKAREELEPGS